MLLLSRSINYSSNLLSFGLHKKSGQLVPDNLDHKESIYNRMGSTMLKDINEFGSVIAAEYRAKNRTLKKVSQSTVHWAML